jgi:hypothetical protein
MTKDGQTPIFNVAHSSFMTSLWRDEKMQSISESMVYLWNNYLTYEEQYHFWFNLMTTRDRARLWNGLVLPVQYFKKIFKM